MSSTQVGAAGGTAWEGMWGMGHLQVSLRSWGKIDHVCIHLVLTHTVAVLCCVLCHALQTLLATWVSLRS